MVSCCNSIIVPEKEDEMERNKEKWTTIESAKIECVDKFWTSIHILNRNLHIVLPRVSASMLSFCGRLVSPTSRSAIYLESFTLLNLSDNANADDILQKLKACGIDLEIIEDENTCDAEGAYIVVQKLILKVPTALSTFWILSCIDYVNTEVIFVLLQCPYRRRTPIKLKFQSSFPLKLDYKDGSMRLMKFVCDEECDSYWLKNTLFAKVLKWTCSSSSLKPTIKSLSLISVDEYVKLYHNLKQKYGSHMVKIWPEKTDPQKFVYEDVAIATYLLLLWSKQRQEAGRPEWKQSFVDLGCGNGLLVYILSSEGHIGKGLDIRKRAIWDYYPKSTHLQVDAITPSNNFLFPDTDWVIGNHSDELTPWIPVIAARSSYTCCFFLLPCCSFDFSGSKYQRQNHHLSQYADYLEYLKYLCKVCGFETLTDRLKIPSTKRICLIGSNRIYSEDESDKVLANIEHLIKRKNVGKGNKTNSSDKSGIIENGSTEWISGFKAREPVEKVRNCTQLDRALRDEIVGLVTQQLLATQRQLCVLSDGGCEKIWNAGRVMEINEIASIMPTSLLQQLKNECGGLQTLLKNNHNIFFVSGGKVQLRTPDNMHFMTMKSKQRKKKRGTTEFKYKTKQCWFHNSHPHGCPLPDEKCTFKH